MKKVYFFGVSYVIFLGVVAFVYVFFISPQVEALFLQEAHPIFQAIVYAIYPRLEVESQRFSADFFLSKADQVLGRFVAIGLIVVCVSVLLLKVKTIKVAFNSFWWSSISGFQCLFLVRIYCVALVGFTWDWSYLFYQLHQINVFYQPTFLLKVLHLPFPSLYTLWFLYGIMLISSILVISQKKPILFSISTILLFIILQGYLISFHKLDHTYSTFIYAGFLIPFVQFEYSRCNQTQGKRVAAWVLVLMQLGIALSYFFSGLEKMLIAGGQWFQPENMRYHFQVHPTDWGLYLSQSDAFCISLAVLTIFFQLGFISIVFFKKLRWTFLPAGIIFHMGTYVLLNIGWYWSPWIFVYVFFINWDFLNKK